MLNHYRIIVILEKCLALLLNYYKFFFSTNNIAKTDKQNYQLNIVFGANISTNSITPLDSSLVPPITPTKVMKNDMY